MFIDCPYCGYLVALDDRGRTAPRCPNCAQRLRGDTAPGGEERAPEGDATDNAGAAPGNGAMHDDDAGGTAATARTQPATQDADGSGMRATASRALSSMPAEAVPGMGEPAPAVAGEDARRTGVAHASPSQDAAQPGTHAPTAARASAAPPLGAAEPATGRPPTQAPCPAPVGDAALSGEPPLPASADAVAAETPAETPADAEAAIPRADARPAPPPAAEAQVQTAAAAEAPSTADPAAIAPAAAPAGRRRSAAVPSFARAAYAKPASRRRLAWELAAIVALCLLLALQLLLSQRVHLAADARWRPVLSALCTALRCTLPPWREPDAFRVLERDVRTQAPGVLRVSARIRNDARWPQPWPLLRLTLSDADGRAVASRLFEPREYLGGVPTQSQLGSGQTMAMRMDIVEPGPQAVAFTFDFQ